MDDLYLDGEPGSLFQCSDIKCPLALGISDDVELLGLKGSKKRKSKKLDEDWMVSRNVLISLALTRLASRRSNRSWKRTFQRSCKPFARRRVVKSCSSC